MTDSLNGIATYFAVPIVPGNPNTKIMICRYFTCENNTWTNAEPPFNSQSGGTSDFVRISQATTEDISNITPHHPDLNPDHESTLFIAIAKTTSGTFGLSNVSIASMDASGHLSVIIPVVANTTRGVIITFAKSTASGNEILMATVDPEIINSTN